MKAFWGWIRGRWEYVALALLLLVDFGLVFTGHLTPETAALYMTVVVGVFAAGLKGALDRRHDQQVALLEEIARAGAAYRQNDKQAAAQEIVRAVKDSVALAGEIKREQNQ